MDETNRAAAIIFALLLMFVATLVILLTWGAPDESIKRMADLANYLDEHNTTATQLLVTFGSLIFVLIGLTAVIIELAPPQTGQVKVAKVGAGDARIGTDEIAKRLQEELRDVPRLRNIAARVISRGSRADVRLDLVVDTEADVAETAGQAIQRTREIVEARMGVELEGPPRADVHYSEEAHRNRPSDQAPANTPSWQPVTQSAPVESTTRPITPRDQPATNTGPTNEATPTAHEDRPSGA